MAAKKILKKELNVNETRHLNDLTKFFQQTNSIIFATTSTEICVANVSFSEITLTFLASFLTEKSVIKLTRLVLTLRKKLRIFQPEKNTGSVSISIISAIKKHQQEVKIIS